MEHTYLQISLREAQATCEICGHVYVFPMRYLSRETAWWLCKSCKAVPVDHLGPSQDYCVPWKGEVDLDTMQPLNPDLTPYRPGHRTCGHADCVRLKHIITES